jgi:hypothetical protein
LAAKPRVRAAGWHFFRAAQKGVDKKEGGIYIFADRFTVGGKII